MGRGNKDDDYSQFIGFKEGVLNSIDEAKNEETIDVSLKNEDIDINYP
jgi:hypothetical protein